MYSALLKYNLKVATPRVDIKPLDPMEASCLEKKPDPAVHVPL